MMKVEYKVLTSNQLPDSHSLNEAGREGYELMSVLFEPRTQQWHAYLKRRKDGISSIHIQDIDWHRGDIHHYDDGLDSPGGVMRDRFWEENGRWPEEDEY